MEIIWDEAAIRRELINLDRRTGLFGAKLSISFGNAQKTLGSFSSDGQFRFSNRFFQDPEWPQEAALDVIRHEYAHYMDYMLNGRCGHGRTWKECCRAVGARPARLYNQGWANYHRNRRKALKRQAALLAGYRPGDRIEHPRFGAGVIVEIEGDAVNRRAKVCFDGVDVKWLGLAWVHDHCGRCEG